MSVDIPPAAAEWFAKSAKRLSLDGSPLPVSAFPYLEEDVGAGPHTVRLEVDGFEPEEKRVEVRDSQVREVRLALRLLPAQLTVISEPAEAEVFHGGSRLGRAGADLSIPALERIELEVRAVGYETGRALIASLPPGGTHRHEVKLSRQIGATLLTATKDNPWVNSLGMKSVPVPGTKVLFCVWETRVQDFEAFVESTRHDATKDMYSLRKDGWKQRGDTWKSPGFPQEREHPVVGVSYEDAVAFCRWLTEKERAEGKLPADWEYRLPTDAEWSAAVGNATYPWGKDWPPPKDAGNYAGEEAKDKDWPDNYAVISNWRDSYPRTAPVGSFARNQYGLYDLGGNVWEWCSDQIGTARVLRGASWSTYHAAYLASVSRINDRPGSRNGNVGFRVVVGGLSRKAFRTVWRGAARATGLRRECQEE